MSKPILCIGRYAENPYHIEKIGRNVYCIEELCYCIVQNAFLLDEDSFNRELFDWIDAADTERDALEKQLWQLWRKQSAKLARAKHLADRAAAKWQKAQAKTN